MWARSWAAMGLALACATAQAQTRGWLRFADGNTLSGELLEQTGDGGKFRSDRFGLLSFKLTEATFEALPSVPPTLAVAPTPSANSGAVDAVLDDQLGWRPGEWSIGVSGYWRRDNGSTTSDLALDLDSVWRSRHDEIKLALSANYKVVDHEVDTNDQSGRLRWLHETTSPWVGLGQVRLNRSTFSLDPLPALDYVLVQGTVGGGVRWHWTGGGRTLVTVNYDRLMLQLLRLDARVYARGVSLLVDNQLRLTPRIDFRNTLVVYRWHGGPLGYDSDAELSYRLTDHLSVGLRHEFRRDAASLDTGTYSRVSLTTRLGF